jgi:hypothetical protein
MFTITLLCIFAMVAIFVAVMGAQVYKSSAEKMQANFDTRLSLVYFAQKIRSCPGENIEVKEAFGGQALVLYEDYDGKTFASWIFVSGGNLYEAMLEDGATPTRGSGQVIMQLESMDVQLRDSMIDIKIVKSDGTDDSITLGRRIDA